LDIFEQIIAILSKFTLPGIVGPQNLGVVEIIGEWEIKRV